MSCDYDIKCQECTCAEVVNASCVNLDIDIPDCSSLSGRASVSVRQSIEDLYKLVCDSEDSQDLSAVNTSCISVPVKNMKNLLESLFSNVCTLRDSVSALPKFSDCNINYGSLQDPCGQVISVNTQCEFNQFIVNQLISLWGRLEALESRV